MPRKSWWARLPFGVRMTAGTTALLVLAGGGVAGVMTMTGGEEERTVATAVPPTDADAGLGAPTLDEDPEVVSRAAAAAEPLPKRHTTAAVPPHTPVAASPADQPAPSRAEEKPTDRTGPRSTRNAEEQRATREPVKQSPAVARTHARPPSAAPVVTTRTDVETREIPFRTQVFRDPTLPRGTREIRSEGSPGEETRRYLVTLTDGKPTGRRLVDTSVTVEPEPRVVVFGARRRFDRDCDSPLQVCVPFGRQAACPDDGSAESPADTGRPQPAGLLEIGSVVLTEEELRLLDPKTLDALRLEPAELC